jgi:hypothetical protein
VSFQPVLPGPTPLPVLVQIGDITCTSVAVITPNGTVPIQSVNWFVTDMSRTWRRTPPWAIIMTVLFVWFFLLSLLFLLAKEEKTEGQIQVVVQGPGFMHSTYIPALTRAHALDTLARVDFARSLTFAAQGRR